MISSTKQRPRNSKYIQLAKQLREMVASGRLLPGDQLPSFVELRNEHQVSRGTVEKVHALLERDGLIVREQGRGIFVASPKKRARLNVIGFVGNGFQEMRTSLYWANIMSGIQSEAIAAGLQLLLLNNVKDSKVFDKIDGLILSENEDRVDAIFALMPESMPRVSMMTPLDNVTCVLSDDYQGAYDATQHLVSLGHTRIGYLVAGHNHLIENRLSGYQAALKEHGIEPRLSWVRQLRLRSNQNDTIAEYTLQGAACIREWLDSDWNDTRCTAIMAQNDHAAVGAIHGLQSVGLNVPSHISVVGFDGTEMYDYFSPSLTTVRTLLREIGGCAIKLLLKQVESGRHDSDSVTLPTHLKIGASSAPLGKAAESGNCR